MKGLIYYFIVTLVVIFAIIVGNTKLLGGINMDGGMWVQTAMIFAAMVSNIIVLVVSTRKSNLRIDDMNQKVDELATGNSNSINELAKGNSNSISELAKGNSNSHMSLSKEHDKINNIQDRIKENIAILMDRTGSNSIASQSLQNISSAISTYANRYDDISQQNETLYKENIELKNTIVILKTRVKDFEQKQKKDMQREWDMER